MPGRTVNASGLGGCRPNFGCFRRCDLRLCPQKPFLRYIQSTVSGPGVSPFLCPGPRGGGGGTVQPSPSLLPRLSKRARGFHLLQTKKRAAQRRQRSPRFLAPGAPLFYGGNGSTLGVAFSGSSGAGLATLSPAGGPPGSELSHPVPRVTKQSRSFRQAADTERS